MLKLRSASGAPTSRDTPAPVLLSSRTSNVSLEAEKRKARCLPRLAHPVSHSTSQGLLLRTARGDAELRSTQAFHRADTMPTPHLDSPGKSPKAEQCASQPIGNHHIHHQSRQASATIKHLKDTFRDLRLVEKLPKVSDTEVRAKFANLPAAKKSKTVVFDLDETLIHKVNDVDKAEAVVQVIHPSGEKSIVGFNIRPFALACIRELSKHWEVVIFTASQQFYADAVLDYLDPAHSLIAHRLYRQHCLHIGSVAVKDLRVLGRSLNDVVIVDNSARSFAFQLDNGVPIREWTENKRDKELEKLAGFMRRLHKEADVRVLLRKTFDLQRFTEDFREATRRK